MKSLLLKIRNAFRALRGLPPVGGPTVKPLDASGPHRPTK